MFADWISISGKMFDNPRLAPTSRNKTRNMRKALKYLFFQESLFLSVRILFGKKKTCRGDEEKHTFSRWRKTLIWKRLYAIWSRLCYSLYWILGIKDKAIEMVKPVAVYSVSARIQHTDRITQSQQRKSVLNKFEKFFWKSGSFGRSISIKAWYKHILVCIEPTSILSLCTLYFLGFVLIASQQRLASAVRVHMWTDLLFMPMQTNHQPTELIAVDLIL